MHLHRFSRPKNEKDRMQLVRLFSPRGVPVVQRTGPTLRTRLTFAIPQGRWSLDTRWKSLQWTVVTRSISTAVREVSLTSFHSLSLSRVKELHAATSSRTYKHPIIILAWKQTPSKGAPAREERVKVAKYDVFSATMDASPRPELRLWAFSYASWHIVELFSTETKI